jgi:hypothetical protein
MISVICGACKTPVLDEKAGVVHATNCPINPLRLRYEAAEDKVCVYETLLHRIQLAQEVTMDANRVVELIDQICAWSRAHRVGNGEYSDEEQNTLIKKAYERFYERSSVMTCGVSGLTMT